MTQVKITSLRVHFKLTIILLPSTLRRVICNCQRQCCRYLKTHVLQMNNPCVYFVEILKIFSSFSCLKKAVLWFMDLLLQKISSLRKYLSYIFFFVGLPFCDFFLLFIYLFLMNQGSSVTIGISCPQFCFLFNIIIRCPYQQVLAFILFYRSQSLTFSTAQLLMFYFAIMLDCS